MDARNKSDYTAVIESFPLEDEVRFKEVKQSLLRPLRKQDRKISRLKVEKPFRESIVTSKFQFTNKQHDFMSKNLEGITPSCSSEEDNLNLTKRELDRMSCRRSTRMILNPSLN